MNDSTDDIRERLQGSFSRVATYAGFARVAHKHLALMEQHLAELPGGTTLFTGDGLDPDIELREQVDEDAAICVLFSAMATEFYINDAGCRALGDRYFKDNLETLSTARKWMVVARFAGHIIDKEGQAWEALRILFRQRDALMHPKSSTYKPSDTPAPPRLPEDTLVKEARRAVDALKMLGQEAALFDHPSVAGMHLGV